MRCNLRRRIWFRDRFHFFLPVVNLEVFGESLGSPETIGKPLTVSISQSLATL